MDLLLNGPRCEKHSIAGNNPFNAGTCDLSKTHPLVSLLSDSVLVSKTSFVWTSSLLGYAFFLRKFAST